MAVENEFVEEALAAANSVLEAPLSIRRGAALLYEVTVNNRLELTVDPKRPKRGSSAFQTGLVLESITFESGRPHLFRSEIILEGPGRVR